MTNNSTTDHISDLVRRLRTVNNIPIEHQSTWVSRELQNEAADALEWMRDKQDKTYKAWLTDKYAQEKLLERLECAEAERNTLLNTLQCIERDAVTNVTTVNIAKTARDAILRCNKSS